MHRAARVTLGKSQDLLLGFCRERLARDARQLRVGQAHVSISFLKKCHETRHPIDARLRGQLAQGVDKLFSAVRQ